MEDRRVELTYRGVAIGAAMTLLFTAANVYAGLKVGLTFATTIPAAVISMAILRAFKNSTIWENNIVQTVASSAGTLSSVIFVLPGLVMVGAWSGFPFWQSFGVCCVGGVLGVMYSVPLRRALVAQSDLPYPEGVAAAEVLKIGTAAQSHGDARHNRAGVAALIGGSVVSASVALLAAMRLIVGELAGYVRVGAATTGAGFGISLLLVGAGHLIGLSVGLAILTGLVVAWGVATPVLTAVGHATGNPATVALTVWSTQVRYLGAGAIGVAALWTLGRLVRPVWLGLASALAAARIRRSGAGSTLARTEHDMPIGLVAAISVVCLVPLAALLAWFLHGGSVSSAIVPLTVVSIAYIVVVGFFVAAACGYMAGLIGSSNSPVSGLAILAVLGISLILAAFGRANPGAATSLVAYALFVTAVLLCIATISNDNLQDLKTGQLVDATPWRQQAALVVGVIVGAVVIPPTLSLLDRAYGFGASSPHALPAPQATLISALAKGVIGGQLDWRLIGIGALIGAASVAVDELLRRRGRALPPLAVGLGIYLPASTTAPVVVGALLGWWYNRWASRRPDPDRAKQVGVLTASGMIVGESLFGVILAGLVVFLKNDNPLAVVGDTFTPWATALGAAVFVAAVAGLYRWTMSLSSRSSVDG
ncbi:MAG TPA: oligopeptide transporter, OPT family [Candidatus Acidoferrales bacterium]|nr:oligopeptide transporter, OPT family [Candidatus Acidoferrales bacterium]